MKRWAETNLHNFGLYRIITGSPLSVVESILFFEFYFVRACVCVCAPVRTCMLTFFLIRLEIASKSKFSAKSKQQEERAKGLAISNTFKFINFLSVCVCVFPGFHS